jgi:hypothetical protein
MALAAFVALDERQNPGFGEDITFPAWLPHIRPRNWG